MGPIIPAYNHRQNHAKMIGDQLSEGLKGYLQKQSAADSLRQENESLEKLGVHATGISDPKIRHLLTAASLKGDGTQDKGELKQDQKSIQKGKELEGALETLQRMKQLRKEDNLGWGSQITRMFSPKARKDAGEYEQLGKSLISLASNIPIRNKLEFETLAEKLYDPSISDDEAEGILAAMERIISNSRSALSDEPRVSSKNSEERPPLTSFMR